MTPTPIIDMFSGTGELARAVADSLGGRGPAPPRAHHARRDPPALRASPNQGHSTGRACQPAPDALCRRSGLGLTPKQWDDVKRRYREKHHSETVASVLARDLEDEEIRLFQTWENVTGAYAPPTGQTCQFMHWMMGLPYRGLNALGLSVSAQRPQIHRTLNQQEGNIR